MNESINNIQATTFVKDDEGQEDQIKKESPNTEKMYCTNCGLEIPSGSMFCPKCGHKIGTEPFSENGSGIGLLGSQTRWSGKKRVGMISAFVGIVALILMVLITRGVQAKDITLNKKNASVKVGDTLLLSFTINPSDTKDKTVTWTSSNGSIAQVIDGKITGLNEGECTITVSTKNGKTDSCIITVMPAGPNLRALYNKYCSLSFASIASDGSYLSIDTNPNNKDDYVDYEAYQAIVAVNKDLKLPESVLNKMNQTRSIDGFQSYSTDDLEISWTYHPDKGLEVNYSLK